MLIDDERPTNAKSNRLPQWHGSRLTAASASEPDEGQNDKDGQPKIHVMDMHPVDDQTTVWSCTAQTQHVSDGTRDDFGHHKGEQRPPWSESRIVWIAEHDLSMSVISRYVARGHDTRSSG